MATKVSQPNRTEAGVGLVASFTGRIWFGGVFKPSEAPTFARLLFCVYEQLQRGHLLSKSEAARLMLSEHKTTANHYVERARKIGLLRVEPSEHDARVHLIVPTERGIKIVEDEARKVMAEVAWLSRYLNSESAEDAKIFVPSTDPYTFLDDVAVNGEPTANAAADYSETLRFFPRNRAARLARMGIAKHAGDIDGALSDNRFLQQAEPDNIEHLIHRALIYHHFKRFPSAMADYERILKMDTPPGSHMNDEQRAVIISGKAYANFMMGNVELACKDYDEVRNKYAHCTSVDNINAPEAYEATEQYEKALDALVKLSQKMPDRDRSEDIARLKNKIRTRHRK